MASTERMMRALCREKPDRLPVTIHRRQQYHPDAYMGGADALTAFQQTGMDAAIQLFEAMGQCWIPNAERYVVQAPAWREEIDLNGRAEEGRRGLYPRQSPSPTPPSPGHRGREPGDGR